MLVQVSFLYEKFAVSTPTFITFIGYPKTFYTIEHSILHFKLYRMGISGIGLI